MIPLLMIRMVLHGVNWLASYWVIACALGGTCSGLNVRHALVESRSVRSGEKDEAALRTTALGSLILHLAIGIVLAVFEVVGVLLVVTSFNPDGLVLDFSNPISEVLVLGVLVTIPGAPALFAFLVWLGRYWTIRALNGSK